ncbi:MAG: bifunctional phosphoribosylaminoimidazolecarboxamide formyltransferase/IMP cyclohydrolase [candidate division WOR-3 bacterium]
MEEIRKKYALISLYDKEGIEELAQVLATQGYEIIATSQTANFLRKKGLKVIEVSEFTHFPEILKGRVKTLHPKIFGGILSYREEAIEPIDFVICNLYPFEEMMKKDLTLDEMIEYIDIGGVSLLRAGAKNYKFVVTIPKKEFYPMVIKELRERGEVSEETKKLLALATFEIVTHYDAVISEYLREKFSIVDFPHYFTKSFLKTLPLRYGENPHQRGIFYLSPFSQMRIEQLGGKELSYNNLLDIDSTLSLLEDFSEATACIMKHNTPCGVGCADDIAEAFSKALESDRKSAFGGVIGVNREVSEKLAEEIRPLFFEVVVAPNFSEEALKILKKKKDLRLIQFSGFLPDLTIRSCLGGILLTDRDKIKDEKKEWQIVSKRRPSEKEMSDLAFAWKVCKFVRSNAIVIAKDEMTVGIGAGQMSRVDSVEIAIRKAAGREKGAVLASDGFFPFRDSIDLAGRAGITAIVEPGGSIRDEEVIKAADENGIALLFTGIRHFRH